MFPQSDYKDQVFGVWKTLEKTNRRRGGSVVWKFECVHCKRIKYAAGAQMKSDAKRDVPLKSVSCKCVRRRAREARRNAIIRAFVTGGSLRAAAVEFNITRQRVEQVTASYVDPAAVHEILEATPHEDLIRALTTVVPKRYLVKVLCYIRLDTEPLPPAEPPSETSPARDDPRG